MRATNRRHTAGSFLAAALVIVGCGGEPQPGQNSSVNERVAQGGRSSGIDACTLITREEASDLFGVPASPDEGMPVTDPNMLGECLWTWDGGTANHLVQVRVWRGEIYYSAPDDAQPLAVGDGGYFRNPHPSIVDISWVQDGLTIGLDYSTVGNELPAAGTRSEVMKELASSVSSRL